MKKNLGSILKEIRGRMTQDEMAKCLSTPKSTYIKWEHGSVFPPPEKLCEIADIYGITVDYLYGREARRIESHEDGITKDEQRLLTGYRALGQEQKSAILNAVVDMVFGLQSEPPSD